MSITDSEEIPGFRIETWTGITAKYYEWYSNFNKYRIQKSGKGYVAIGEDEVLRHNLTYYDTLEEAVNYVRYRAITNFLGNEEY